MVTPAGEVVALLNMFCIGDEIGAHRADAISVSIHSLYIFARFTCVAEEMHTSACRSDRNPSQEPFGKGDP
jgi:hypothetical protein